MNFSHLYLSLIFAIIQVLAYTQVGVIEGVLTDNLGSPAAYVNVVSTEQNKGTLTNLDGSYSLEIPANRKTTIRIQGLNYEDLSVSVKLSEGEVLLRNFTIQIKAIEITVVGEQDKERKEISTGIIETKDVAVLPNVGGGVETYLVTQLGVQKNNELSSSYSVRGGNFDENLVYVNDFEIYRPFLIRSGQQEGLSFVNPDMTDKLKFSSGGFQAKYGDKMASVLDVDYRRPKEFGGSVESSLLGANVHLEGTNKSKQFTYSTGFRYKNSRIILGSQDI
ncbi:MAG: carboxypeptidase-like regulatory domain-containing protein, partial [Chitinophagales bacterium]|nr:carboxypeptidase-like regulatory domain-containing protein [Chitinophagales bacterium]